MITMLFFHRIALLVFFAGWLFSTKSLTAQLRYSAKDSLEIFELLDKSDVADMKGDMKEAFVLVSNALEKSRKNQFLRGQAFALLKMADLKLKTDGTNGLEKYYQEARDIATPLNDNFLNGLIHLQQAQQQIQAANYQTAEKLCREALSFFQRTDSMQYKAYTFNELGLIADLSGKYEESAGFYLKAIPLFEKYGDIKEAANTKGNLAIISYRLGKKEEALSIFKESARTRESIQDIKGLAATYGNIATVYLGINLDSAEKYFGLQLLNAGKSGVKSTMAQAIVNNMALKDKQQKPAEALEFELKAIDIYTEIGDKNKLGMRHASAGILYNKLNDSINAETHFKRSEEIGFSLRSKPILQNLYYQKSNFYQARKDFAKALENIKLYYLYRDSLINEKTNTNIADLKTRYETAKKDQEIQQLQATAKIQELELDARRALLRANQSETEKNRQDILILKQDQKLKAEDIRQKEELLTRQALIAKNNQQQLMIAQQEKRLNELELQREKLIRNITFSALLLAIAIGFILFSRYRLRRKLQEQKKILTIRDNISKDLHDEIGSTLTSINILSNISQQAFTKDPDQAKGLLQKITDQTKTIQQNISDIVWSLRPENETIENLEVRMREFAAQTLENNNIKTQFSFDGELYQQELTHATRKNLLLIYKEALNNIIKHAQASHVEISLESNIQKMRMLISDDGIGLKSSGNISSGTGTKTMEQRAKEIGGHLTVERRNNGTRVILEIPIT